ncbi:MAG: hypothetical protein AABM29_03125 [Actinomycetota bacterium]
MLLRVQSARPSEAPVRQRGSASVELIAVIPMLGLALLVAAQVALAGASLWSAGIAARAGARAAHVGGEAGGAALRALPPALRQGASVRDGDGVRVRVRVPELLSVLPPLSVDARSSLGTSDAAAR